MSKKLRIVIVTGRQKRHLNLCGTIASKYDVVGVLHPRDTLNDAKSRFARLVRHTRRHGLSLATMRFLGVVFGTRGAATAARRREQYTWEGADLYRAISSERVHVGCLVREPSATSLLRSLRPDVTICLGGPIYPKAFIEASPLTLNFHSGISPIYNGSSSAEFAFANGHPHLCGGTLMKMNRTVDGGEILAHFLPSVESGDSPSSLFTKTVIGAVTTYDHILEYLTDHPNDPPVSIPQPAPLFYTRGVHLGWYQTTMIAQYFRQDIASRMARPQELIEYWRSETTASARHRCLETINRLLWSDGFESR